MSLVSSSTPPLINELPRRIPKLAVRNSTPESKLNSYDAETTRASASVKFANGDATPPSSCSSQCTIGPVDKRKISSEEREYLRRRSRMSDPSATSKAKSQQQQAKKRSGIIGFVALKEPSTTAWEAFAEAEKARARKKTSRGTPVGMPGVSSKKLPEHVPKVNSKWDGLPDSAKTKRTRTGLKSTDRKSKEHLAFLTSTRHSDPSTSTAGKASGGGSLQLPTHTHRPSTLSSRQCVTERQSTSDRLSIPPAIQDPVIEESQENRPQTILCRPSPPHHNINFLPELPSTEPIPELEAQDWIHVRELDAASTGAASPAVRLPRSPSPVGGINGFGLAALGLHYPEVASATQTATADTKYTSWRSDVELSENEMGLSKEISSPPPAMRPASVNFSRPRPRKPAALALEPPAAPPLRISNEEGQGKSSEEIHIDEIVLPPALTSSSGYQDPPLTDTLATRSRVTGEMPISLSFEDPLPEEYPLKGSFALSTVPTSGLEDASSFDSEVPVSTLKSLEDSRPASIRSHSANSVISEEWQVASKERLGLGIKLRKSEVLPWEDLPDGAAEASSYRNGEFLDLASPPSVNKLKLLSGRLLSRG